MSSFDVKPAKSPLMVQVVLKGFDGSEMTTWVEKRHNLRRGAAVRLKDETEWRKVDKVYDLEIPKDQLDLNRGWDNNI